MALFGYEPPLEHLQPPLDGYSCALTPAQCLAAGNPYARAARGAARGAGHGGASADGHRQASGSADVPSDSAHCAFYKGTG